MWYVSGVPTTRLRPTPHQGLLARPGSSVILKTRGDVRRSPLSAFAFVSCRVPRESLAPRDSRVIQVLR